MHISEIRNFFNELKIETTEYPFTDIADEAAFVYPKGTHTIITVLSNNFLFTEAGNFIGIMCAESGVLQLAKEGI